MSRNPAPRIDCALDLAMSVIEGKWKAPILCKLISKGDMRFNQLMRELETVSPRILTKQLREMEKDGLIKRTVYPEVPACVEYSITERGKSLAPPLKMLAQWSLDNMYCNRVVFEEGMIVTNKSSR